MKNYIKKTVDIFLTKYGIHHELIDMEKTCKDFICEMEKGLKGEESTLKMLCTYISLEKEIKTHESVIVLDAGGTNFRIAVVEFDENLIPKITDFKMYKMPGTTKKIEKDDFFELIVEYLEPVINKSNKIGFCFSYAAEMLPNIDGRLIKFNKEVKIKGMRGEEIGANLVSVLKNKGYDKKVFILNDTVATLLGVLSISKNRVFDGYIGFILGTGTNTCYSEMSTNVLNSKLVGDREIIINVESGGYGLFEQSYFDVLIDNMSEEPGMQKLEKMISGAYQGKILNEILKKASEEGLFSKGFSEKLKQNTHIETKDISEFCTFPYSDNKLSEFCSRGSEAEDEIDRQTLYFIIDNLIERSAKIVTVNLASVILKIGKGKNPCKPVFIAVEGSTFEKLYGFRGKLNYHVKCFLNEKLSIYCEFISAQNATFIGAANAALMFE